MGTVVDQPTFICLPQGICSWSFLIFDSKEEQAGELSFRGFFAYPVIDYGGVRYAVHNDRELFKSRLVLAAENALPGTSPLAVAQISFSFFKRQFIIEADGRKFIVQRNGSAFEIFSGNTVCGVIAPEHFFTKRSRIYCNSQVPVLIQLFCFALVVRAWRQDASAAASAS